MKEEKRGKEAPAKSLEDLIREAESMPGVAGAMQVYRKSEKILAQARPYMRVLRPKILHTASDGSA